MRTDYKFRLLIALVLSGCSLLLKAQTNLELKNPGKIPRSDELIVLNRAFLERRLGKIGARDFVKVTGGDRERQLQYDDLDRDGQWDQLAFLQSFGPAETVKLTVSRSRQVPRAGNVLAHVRQRRKKGDETFGPSLSTDSVPPGQPSTDFARSALPPFLTEGPAWENDKVGFRIYMDVRNTKDIWGKTTSKMMMDTVGVDPKVIYHHLADWGMDILAVGKSLGAGSLALRVPVLGKPDTLVRLGGPHMGKIIYRKLADGPLRAIFEMEYPEWDVLGNGQLTSITERISIWGGQYFYESEVKLTNAPAGSTLVTGIVNLKSSKCMKDSVNQVMMLSSFDKQSENQDNLGLALLVRKPDLIRFAQTPGKTGEITDTYTADLKIYPAAHPVTFRFYSCWERSSPDFSKAAAFKTYLFKEAEKYNQQINLRWH